MIGLMIHLPFGTIILPSLVIVNEASVTSTLVELPSLCVEKCNEPLK